MQTEIVNNTYTLEKFPGKGGWTYALIPELSSDTKTPFGWQVVNGFIDDYELVNYKLMPFGKGKLFLPVKASIRKVIGKKEGDKVHIKLYANTSNAISNQDIVNCLKDSPTAYANYLKLSQSEQESRFEKIHALKTETAKIEHIVRLIEELENKIP
jgi:hypothetical protein